VLTGYAVHVDTTHLLKYRHTETRVIVFSEFNVFVSHHTVLAFHNYGQQQFTSSTIVDFQA